MDETFFTSIVGQQIISKLDQQYVEILEKTNQQLGLWTNPYGLMVTVLTFFVTILAVVVAWAIYRQGADYKKKLEEQLTLLVDTRFEKFESAITEQRKKLGMATSEEEKVEILSRIKQLEQAKTEAIARAETPYVSPEVSFGSLNSLTGSFGSPRMHKCTYCKYGYIPQDFGLSVMVSVIPQKRAYSCPKCGNVDEV